MTNEILLSILTPALPSRLAQLDKLCSEVQSQIGSLPVEHLVLVDNKRRTIGEKRDALLRAAIGRYVAFVDDDDWIAPDYVRSILAEIEHRPDVITFEQVAYVDGRECKIIFGLGNPNEQWTPGGIAKRNAWHICAWRTDLAILSHFPPVNYGEDWAFASKLCGLRGLTSRHIPRVLHYYRHSTTGTEAPPPV